MEKVKQDLHIYNSALEIDNEEATNLKLEYEFYDFSIVHYENGKKESEIKKAILFEIIGKLKDKREVSFEFELHLSLDELNKFPKKPVDISKYIGFDYLPLRVGDDARDIVIVSEKNDINDIYKKLSSVLIYKEKKNLFLIKLHFPEENFFTYFEVDFN